MRLRNLNEAVLRCAIAVLSGMAGCSALAVLWASSLPEGPVRRADALRHVVASVGGLWVAVAIVVYFAIAWWLLRRVHRWQVALWGVAAGAFVGWVLYPFSGLAEIDGALSKVFPKTGRTEDVLLGLVAMVAIIVVYPTATGLLVRCLGRTRGAGVP